ncbi:MAG: hypothetical protein KKA73_15020 [Chloroflexi bacterium]|nr:hypothetical protein [Chloroflexota bacterium]MBU1748999.1 hypothetical protein [Chloroflexota bacterium]
MSLGVYFREDLAAKLAAIEDAATALARERGGCDAADAAYLAGYRAALRAVAVSVGLAPPAMDTSWILDLEKVITAEKTPL